MEPGFPGINTAQVSVGTTATQILANRTGRSAVTIIQHGTTDVFVGASGVGTGTGALLPGTKGSSLTIPFTGAVFGIAASTQTVSFLEVF